jgi:hypothetical protein
MIEQFVKQAIAVLDRSFDYRLHHIEFSAQYCARVRFGSGEGIRTRCQVFVHYGVDSTKGCEFIDGDSVSDAVDQLREIVVPRMIRKLGLSPVKDFDPVALGM